MSDKLLTCGLQYLGYVLEAAICLLILCQGRWRRLKGFCLYVAALFMLDGVARSAVLNFFGQASRQYNYFYWLTDVVLAIGAFLLTCAFFRRAFAQEEKMWRVVRLALVSVFVLVLGISALSLTRNYAHLYTLFIVEFSQNLYFSCLVLNTLLYVMMQQLAIDDDELGLLVCGMGVQFAGEAACLALFHLTVGEHFARVIFSFVNPACTLGMLLIWIYAIVKVPEAVPVPSQVGKQAALAEALLG
jgi:membrane-associated HD superfamily phosphohydrolase